MRHRSTWFEIDRYLIGLIIAILLMIITIFVAAIVMKIKNVDKKESKKKLIKVIIFFVAFELLALIYGIVTDKIYRNIPDPRVTMQIEQAEKNALEGRFYPYLGNDIRGINVKELLVRCNEHNSNDEIVKKWGAVSVIFKEGGSGDIENQIKPIKNTGEPLKTKDDIEVVKEESIETNKRYNVVISKLNYKGFISEITIYKQNGMITE